MRVDKLTTSNIPTNQFQRITGECSGEYPINKMDGLTKNSIVVDCGANIGGFVNAFKGNFHKFICIEASSYNVEQIQINNKSILDRIDLHHKAVSDKSFKTVKLMKYVNDNGDDSPSGCFGTIEYEFDTGAGWKDDVYEEIQTISLEEILSMVGGSIDLLKVDVEGAEYDFLYNKDLSNIKYITMEVHNFLGKKRDELINWIENTHEEIDTKHDGVSMHYVKTWKLVNEK